MPVRHARVPAKSCAPAVVVHRAVGLPAMRRLPGGDHADTNQAGHYRTPDGHRARVIDGGAFDYDAEDDYPRSASPRPSGPSLTRAAWASSPAVRAMVSRSRPTGAGRAVRAGLERRDRETGPRAQQRPVDRHRRAHALHRGRHLAIVDAFLSTAWSEAPRHQRRIDILADYEKTHPACGPRRPRIVPGARGPTRCTGWPGCINAATAGHRYASAARRAGSPTGPRWSTAMSCAPPRPTAAPVPPLPRPGGGEHVVHIHLGLYGTFSEFDTSDIPDPVGQVRCAWSAPSTAPTCAGRRGVR